MTTVTEDAFDWYQARAIGNTDAVIDTVAVGSGTDSEEQDPDGLDEEEYRNDTGSNIIEIEQTAGLGEIEARIEITGGTEVDAETEISEMMAYVGDDEVIVAVDNFSPVEIDSGQTERFTLPVAIERDD